jgi:hypothetical protein
MDGRLCASRAAGGDAPARVKKTRLRGRPSLPLPALHDGSGAARATQHATAEAALPPPCDAAAAGQRAQRGREARGGQAKTKNKARAHHRAAAAAPRRDLRGRAASCGRGAVRDGARAPPGRGAGPPGAAGGAAVRVRAARRRRQAQVQGRGVHEPQLHPVRVLLRLLRLAARHLRRDLQVRPGACLGETRFRCRADRRRPPHAARRLSRTPPARPLVRPTAGDSASPPRHRRRRSLCVLTPGTSRPPLGKQKTKKWEAQVVSAPSGSRLYEAYGESDSTFHLVPTEEGPHRFCLTLNQSAVRARRTRQRQRPPFFVCPRAPPSAAAGVPGRSPRPSPP